MTDTTTAAMFSIGACALLLVCLSTAKSLRASPSPVVVTITRINGQKVTQEVGTVRKWSLSDGRMTLEYVPDPAFQDGFDAPR